MKIDKLPKITHKSKKRVGRGYGSGRAKTSGRGTKGQKARNKVKLGFEGGQLPYIRRLPYKRGFTSLATKPLVINVDTLNYLKDGTVLTEKLLIELGLFPMSWKHGVKILGDGELKKKITVKGITCSNGAVKKIEDAGGSVEK